MKKPPITKLSFSSTVFPIGRPEGRFVELSRGGFVFTDHLVGIRERAKDFVRVAERFVGVPYLWGGKTSLGIDCSGLVQISLQAAGVPCLRDSDMQMATAGEPQDPKNIDAIQRGDLLFWKGHVAIAQSPDWIIHASGHHMEVVVEPIRRALERTAETDGPLLAILRPMIERPVAQQTPAPQQVETAGPAPTPAAASRKDNEAGAQPPPPSPAVPNESEVAAATAAVQAAAKVRPGTEIQDRARQAAAEALLARPMGAKSQEKPKQGGQR
jgi:hypothetical protein